MHTAKTDQPTLIRRATAESSMGWILAAATNRGICFVAMANTNEELEKALRTEFPGAEIVKGDARLDEMLERIVSLVEQPGELLDLPLDVHGTPFQERVWNALQDIPAGSTISYGKLAADLGIPKGARAVAGACAANNVSLVIPCHRVVRGDGSLGGYRWGLERKKELLQREQNKAKISD